MHGQSVATFDFFLASMLSEQEKWKLQIIYLTEVLELRLRFDFRKNPSLEKLGETRQQKIGVNSS